MTGLIAPGERAAPGVLRNAASDADADADSGSRSGNAPSRHGVAVVALWELDKLVAQLRVRLAFLVCLVGPWGFLLAVKVSATIPSDTLFGRWILDSGWSAALVVIGFAASWGFPLLCCLVAGDIFSAEDHLGTWQTVLTRSRARHCFFLAKTIAAGCYVLAALALLAASSIAAGVVLVGHQPLFGLSGNQLGAGHAAALVLLAWLSEVLPCLAFAAFGLLLSVATRNSFIAILVPVGLGLVLQFTALVDGLGLVRQLLPGVQFSAWQGLFADPSYSRPAIVASCVGAVYAIACVGAAWLLFRRRDVHR